MQFWSIGHSTHSTDEFLALLGKHGIEAVADVRRVPRSSRHPQFETRALAQALGEHGLGYRHLARLGGWRRAAADSPNEGWRNSSFRGYADYALTDDFSRGLDELRELASTGRVALMCSEALWWRCHRRLIADRLLAQGDSISHIDPAGHAVRHVLPAFAAVAGGVVTYPAARDGDGDGTLGDL